MTLDRFSSYARAPGERENWSRRCRELYSSSWSSYTRSKFLPSSLFYSVTRLPRPLTRPCNDTFHSYCHREFRFSGTWRSGVTVSIPRLPQSYRLTSVLLRNDGKGDVPVDGPGGHHLLSQLPDGLLEKGLFVGEAEVHRVSLAR